MDKRISWNFDSSQHATFNPLRPIGVGPGKTVVWPPDSKTDSQFGGSRARFPDYNRMIGGPAINIRIFHRRFTLRAGVVALILIGLWVIAIGPEPPSRMVISPEELVRAVTIQREPLIDLALMEHVDPNGRDAQGRTPLLIATSQQDWKTARRLLDAGAVVDLADKNGFTPVMAAAMHGDVEMFQLLLARSTNLQPEKPTADGQDLLSVSLDGGHPEIIKTVEQRLPTALEWTTSTRRALSRALQAGKTDEIRLLLSKQSAPPTPEGKNVPFLAYAIASNNASLFSTLLNCGADPNTVLPSRCDKDFLALLPKGLRSYIEGDSNVTVLMLASGLGQVDYSQALIDGRANRTRLTSRNKMSALDIAAETGHWRSAQILLGGGPAPDKLRVEISLGMQRVALLRDGKPIYQARCSTGRPGYSTKRGEFVVTNKERSHRSTIYHVDMPYFMRLSCLDFGMHAGYVPNYPASHGCIRLPEDTARKFFSEIPVGTLVTVQ
ncbi:MAG: ankyrin repeat domain-containing protein [Candidatus Udaeobacter sp.]